MSKFEENRIFILNNPDAPRLCPELAAEIGLHESIILLQIDFWIAIGGHWYDDKKWTYQSVRDIQRKFPYMGLATVNRAIKNLIKHGLLYEGNYNKYKYDKTRWFAINFEGCRKLHSINIAPAWQQACDTSNASTGHGTGHDTRSNQNGTPPVEADPFQSGTGSFQDGTQSNQFGTRSSQSGTRSNQFGTTIPEISTEISTETSIETSTERLQSDASHETDCAGAQCVSGKLLVQTSSPSLSLEEQESFSKGETDSQALEIAAGTSRAASANPQRVSASGAARAATGSPVSDSPAAGAVASRPVQDNAREGTIGTEQELASSALDDSLRFEPNVAGVTFRHLGKNENGRHEFEAGEGRVRAVIKQRSTLTDYSVFKRVYETDGSIRQERVYTISSPTLGEAQATAVELLNEIAAACAPEAITEPEEDYRITSYKQFMGCAPTPEQAEQILSEVENEQRWPVILAKVTAKKVNSFEAVIAEYHASMKRTTAR